MNEANARRRRRQQRLLYLTGSALTAAFVLLVVAVVLLQQQSRQASYEIQRQSELNSRLRQLQSVLIQLASAETGQRGYLLTGDRIYLAPYSEALAQLPTTMEALDGLDSVEPGLALKATYLKESIFRKLGELAETIRLHDNGKRTEALVLIQTGDGRQAMEEARREIDEILREVRGDSEIVAGQVSRAGERREVLAAAAIIALALCVTLAATQIGLLLTSRTRYEQQLRDSEARHRSIVEDQSEFISLARADGTLTYVNPAYSRLFDTTAAALTGQNLFDHIEPAHREDVRQLVDKVLASGKPNHGQNLMRLPDGRQAWVAWTNSVQPGADGTPQLHSVGRDITNQKLAEQALRESEEFLDRTGRLAGVGGWEVDLASGEVSWSEQVRQLHEVEPDFKPTLESGVAFFEPSARATLSEAVANATREGVPFDLELPLMTAKGRRRCVRVVGDAQRDTSGNPTRLVGALQDITERKELEERLRENERFLREITDNLPVAIAYVDLHGRYQFVNEVHVRRFGRARDDIIGKTRAQLTDDPLEGGAEKVAGVLRGEPQRFLVQEAMGTGELRLIDAQMVPARDDRGEIKGFYATGMDITDLKRAETKLRELTEIIENTPDFVVQTDWAGRVHYLNPSARKALEIAEDQAVDDRYFHEFNTPETNARYLAEITPTVKREGVWLGETTVLGAQGSVLPVNHLVIGHRDAQGRIVRYSAVMRDISEEVRARAELQLQTSTLHAIIESIPAMVAVFDRDLRYRLVNREFERQRAVQRSEVIGRGVGDLFGAEEFNERWPWMQRVLAGETITRERIAQHAGNVKNVSVTYIPLRLSDGSVDGFITIAQDITTHKEEERRLFDLSQRDALTGLLNRAGFASYVERHLGSADQVPLALLYIDLDRFKPVNDTYGHATGDAVLQQFAQRLQSLVRPTDGVARLGGDEFAIVLPGVRDRGAAQSIGHKVVDAASKPFSVDGKSVQIGASVGVAVSDETEADMKQLVALADERVYAAKAAGRGRTA